MKNSEEVQRIKSADIAIVTALPEEYMAVREVFSCGPEVEISGEGAGRRYCSADVTSTGGGTRIIVVAMMGDMGNNSASMKIMQMSQHLPRIQNFVMVGIAGAVPYPAKAEDHVRLGDIVVSDRRGVVQYDFDKEESENSTHRHSPRPPGAALLEAVKSLSTGELVRQRPWEAYIKKAVRTLGTEWRRPKPSSDLLKDSPTSDVIDHPKDSARKPGHPRVFHGAIASANKLLKNPDKRDILRDKFGAKAIEMEGSGVADTTWTLEKGYLVIRGTCDYCNSTKDDQWHNYAAIVAAAYARCVIEALGHKDTDANSGRIDDKPKSIQLKIANTDTTIDVCFGDFFAKDGLRVVAVTEFFESKLGTPVSANSLHGNVLIREFAGKPEKFDAQVSNQLKKVSSTSVVKAEGKKKRFPIGTAVLITGTKSKYILFALCNADPQTCKATASMSMLLCALDGLWACARACANGAPVNLPLVGSGLAGLGLPPRDLLNLIILSAIVETKVKEIAKLIRVVLHDSLSKHVDLREIEQHWRQ